MATCCGNPRLIPYTTRPPRAHDGPCTPECDRPGTLCLNCRLARPRRLPKSLGMGDGGPPDLSSHEGF